MPRRETDPGRFPLRDAKISHNRTVPSSTPPQSGESPRSCSSSTTDAKDTALLLSISDNQFSMSNLLVSPASCRVPLHTAELSPLRETKSTPQYDMSASCSLTCCIVGCGVSAFWNGSYSGDLIMCLLFWLIHFNLESQTKKPGGESSPSEACLEHCKSWEIPRRLLLFLGVEPKRDGSEGEASPTTITPLYHA